MNFEFVNSEKILKSKLSSVHINQTYTGVVHAMFKNVVSEMLVSDICSLKDINI